MGKSELMLLRYSNARFNNILPVKGFPLIDLCFIFFFIVETKVVILEVNPFVR